MHATGEYSINYLADLFSVSRLTIHRTLNERSAIEWRAREQARHEEAK